MESNRKQVTLGIMESILSRYFKMQRLSGVIHFANRNVGYFVKNCWTPVVDPGGGGACAIYRPARFSNFREQKTK